MAKAVDTVWRLGASSQRECYRASQTENEFPSPHVCPRSIDDRVAQANALRPACEQLILQTFSGHRARHEALDYFVGYAAVTSPTVVVPDQCTAITIRPRHHGLVGHVCPHAIKSDFVMTSRLVLCLPITRFDMRRV